MLGNLAGPEVADQITGISKNLNEITRKINEGPGTLSRILNDESLYDSLNAAVIDTQAVNDSRVQAVVERFIIKDARERSRSFVYLACYLVQVFADACYLVRNLRACQIS